MTDRPRFDTADGHPWPYTAPHNSLAHAMEDYHRLPPDVEPVTHSEEIAMSPDALTPVVVRIIMRYLSGALIAWGFIAPDTGADVVADADLETLLTVVVGLALGLLSELWYRRARVTGGPT